MKGNLFDEEHDRHPGGASGWITAHCDGGSRGNPGPAGFGAVITGPGGEVLALLSRFLGVQTNNFAEYSGLLAVLKWALENGHRRLRVVSDSELMVQQMKGRYKVASPLLRPLWEEARRLARQLEGFEISHTLRRGNKEADRLANEAMDKGTGKTGNRDQGSGRTASVPTPTRSPRFGRDSRPEASSSSRGRSSKATSRAEWSIRWKASSPTASS
jgi:ribonuclease HI